MPLLRRVLSHPFFPGLKLTPATRAKTGCPAISGTFQELVDAAAAGVRVTRAVVPLHGPADPFLSDGEREALWEMFGVPVWAMLLDGRGRLIGYECEVQEGFHLSADYPCGLLFGTADSSACECGRAGPRLLPAEPARAEIAMEAGSAA
jgi:hypothetical protein